MKRTLIALAATFACAAALAEYPDKPVTIVVPFAAAAPPTRWPVTSPRYCARG